MAAASRGGASGGARRRGRRRREPRRLARSARARPRPPRARGLDDVLSEGARAQLRLTHGGEGARYPCGRARSRAPSRANRGGEVTKSPDADAAAAASARRRCRDRRASPSPRPCSARSCTPPPTIVAACRGHRLRRGGVRRRRAEAVDNTRAKPCALLRAVRRARRRQVAARQAVAASPPRRSARSGCAPRIASAWQRRRVALGPRRLGGARVAASDGGRLDSCRAAAGRRLSALLVDLPEPRVLDPAEHALATRRRTLGLSDLQTGPHARRRHRALGRWCEDDVDANALVRIARLVHVGDGGATGRTRRVHATAAVAAFRHCARDRSSCS